MSNLVGVQTQWDSAEMLRWLEIVGSRWCMGINVFKREYLEKIKARGAKYIYRHHPNFDEIGLAPWFVDPELAAQEAVAFLRGHLGALDLVDYVTDGNEYVLGPTHETPERIALADRYMAAFIKAARLFLGKGAIVGNFNTGHWRREGELNEYFPLMLQALQEDCEENPEDGAKIGWHEYNWPLLRDDGYWRTATFLRAMPAIIERYPLARCLITELGIDRCADEWGVGHAGFRMVHPDLSVAIDMFCGGDGLAWYVDRLLEAPYVDGVLLFGCGMTDWRAMGFDVMNDPEDTTVPDLIGYLPDAAPPEPPELNGGDNVIPDNVRIYDFDHGPHADDPTASKEWLASIFGPCIDVHPVSEIHQLQPGDLYWQLQWINCKPGTTSIIIELENEAGQAAIGEIVIFGWPDAGPHGYASNSWNWTANGVPGTTEAPDGHVGPGIDSYYSPDEGECGPFFLWIWGNYPSEMVDGAGMLSFHDLVPGANHLHPEFGFKLTRYEGEEPVPPDPGEPGEALEIIASIRVQLDQLAAILSTLDARTEALAAELSDLI